MPTAGDTSQRVWAAVGSFAFPPADFYPSGGRVSYIAKNLVVHIMVLKPSTQQSGLSGRAVRLYSPRQSTRRISAAIAHNRAHEFSHALARLTDEYLDHQVLGLGADNARAGESAHASNVVREPACSAVPWAHLLFGSRINPSVDQLVGAFGTADIGYHSELKCLMNGTHDNADFYGGNGRLRVYDRFCNFCRELTTFRILERTGVLPDSATSMATWIADYRIPFYTTYGFTVPAVVPQTNSDGEPRFEACAP